MKLRRKKVINIEEENTQEDIYASFKKTEDVNPTGIEPEYQYLEKEKDHYLDDHSSLTTTSKTSRLLLYGFYVLIILIGIIIFFLLRADRYAFYLVKDEVSISNGGSYQVELTPKYAQYFDYLNYDYQIDDESIAKVDEFGTVTAVGNGTTNLKISLSPGFTSKKMRINSNINSIENISLLVYKNNKLQKDSRITMEVNETITLKAIANEDDKSFIDVKYSSSNENIVIIDEFGNVTAKGAGEATISGVKDDIVGEISITVTKKETPSKTTSSNNNKISKINIGTNQVTKYIGESITLSITTTPKNVKTNSITWTSSNPKVASVTNAGVVQALKKGTAVITVNIDGVKDTCTIIVKEKVTSTTPTPTVPQGTQFQYDQVKLSKTSTSIKAGKTDTFTLTLNKATGTFKITSSDSSVAKIELPQGDPEMPICNQSTNICLLDAFTKADTITIKVTGVKAGTAYINVVINNVDTTSDQALSGTGKVGVLVE